MDLLAKPLTLIGLAALGVLGACACAPPEAVAPPPPPPPVREAPPLPPPLPAPLPAPLPEPDGLLPAPPANAQPGECFAKVRVPGQALVPPPAPPRAVWVFVPAAPGLAGPSFCLQWLPGAPRPLAFTPERYGWIRVICDRDITREMVLGVQHRLHAWGLYDGAYDGRLDRRTALALRAFQARRRIDHGGYLSMTTLEALRGEPGASLAPPPGPAVEAPPYPGPAVAAPPTMGFPTMAFPAIQPPNMGFSPSACDQGACPPIPAPPCAAWGGCSPTPPWGPVRAPPLLTWPGKSLY